MQDIYESWKLKKGRKKKDKNGRPKKFGGGRGGGVNFEKDPRWNKDQIEESWKFEIMIDDTKAPNGKNWESFLTISKQTVLGFQIFAVYENDQNWRFWKSKESILELDTMFYQSNFYFISIIKTKGSFWNQEPNNTSMEGGPIGG